MNKVTIFLTGLFLMSLGILKARENAFSSRKGVLVNADTLRQATTTDTLGMIRDTLTQIKDSSVAVKDTAKDTGVQVKDSATATKDSAATIKDTSTASVAPVPSVQQKDSSVSPPQDPVIKPATDSSQTVRTEAPANPTTVSTNTGTPPADSTSQQKIDPPAVQQDSAAAKSKIPDDGSEKEEDTKGKMDTRWFISPLLKFQFQDFAMLEKNRKGYLSDANTLPFQKRGNGSFAASVYKNLIGGLSISADLGLSFGHVTNDNTLISQTQSKNYNLLNAALYYNLLSPAYKLQPYVTVGINDLINDASYLSAPMGIGARFTSKKIMVLGQLTYGYAVNKNVSNTTMYSIGVYIPVKTKKQKQQEKDDNSPYNRSSKNDDKKKDKDSTSKGGITNNIYITINMDSVLRAKGLLNDDGSPKGKNGGEGDDDDDNGGNGGGKRGRHKSSLRKDLRLDQDFTPDDYKVDTINGMPVVRFVVYFEFNDWGLNSQAFATIDKVMDHLRSKPNLTIEIKGYTDDIGDNSYNNSLSRRRAKMVLEYMNSRGVPSDYMKAKAYGSDNPVADNRNPNTAWLNRRAEIIVHEN